MADVLRRLAHIRQGGVVEADGSTLGPAHGYFFRRAAHYHATCDGTFAALRRIAQSIEQRGLVLPPVVPRRPAPARARAGGCRGAPHRRPVADAREDGAALPLLPRAAPRRHCGAVVRVRPHLRGAHRPHHAARPRGPGDGALFPHRDAPLHGGGRPRDCPRVPDQRGDPGRGPPAVRPADGRSRQRRGGRTPTSPTPCASPAALWTLCTRSTASASGTSAGSSPR